MIYQWRALMDEYAKNDDKIARVIMTEAYTSLENIIKFYKEGNRMGSHVPFNFELISNVNTESTAKDYYERINSWLDKVPEGCQSNWVVCTKNKNKLKKFLIKISNFSSSAITTSGEWQRDWVWNVRTC
jgi:alpha-glucosidase